MESDFTYLMPVHFGRYEYAEKSLHFSTICPATIATPSSKNQLMAPPTMKSRFQMMHILLIRPQNLSGIGLQNTRESLGSQKNPTLKCGKLHPGRWKNGRNHDKNGS